MELGNDLIIGFRTRGNATAVDYRGEMALKATEISALRAMSANVEDTEEFNVVLASLIRMIFRVGCHEWCGCPGVTVTIFKKRFFSLLRLVLSVLLVNAINIVAGGVVFRSTVLML